MTLCVPVSVFFVSEADITISPVLNNLTLLTCVRVDRLATIFFACFLRSRVTARLELIVPASFGALSQLSELYIPIIYYNAQKVTFV